MLQAREILRDAGLKCTPGRMALLELLLEEKKPLSQQEIARGLVGVDFNYVSIYRSLDAFLKAGIVHRVEAGDRTWRYALCGCGSHRHCHPHFICRECGRVECLSDFQGAGFKEDLPEDYLPGYVVEERELYLRGLCRDCS